MSETTRSFLQSVLQPNEEFSRYVDTVRTQIPCDAYTILHLRLGDQYLINSKQVADTLARKLVNGATTNTIVVTDSMYLKEILKTSGIACTLDLKVGHIGYYKTPSEYVRDSLAEFFIISGAKQITSVTCYGWVSGFVHIVSIIYNIKLVSRTNMRL